MSIHSPEFDVAIIGLGPTGATLANLLCGLNLSVLVLEREADLYDLPRAVHFDDETMRIFQWVGIAEELAQQAFINRGMRFIDAQENVLLDWPRPTAMTSNGWHASYRFHQPDLERALRTKLTARHDVEIRLGHRAESLHDHGSQVSIEYRNGSTGEAGKTSSRYVVGCDGARSVVRRAMNADMENLGFEQRWLVVDLLLRKEMPALADRTIQFCDPVRPATYCRNVGLRRRWEFALLDDEDSSVMMDKANIWKMLRRWITRDDAILERSAVYTFKSAVAETWRTGRLILAGDSAHLTPPFMGQGMCAGIRDVANLAWKLDRCCRGRGGEALLDSYQSERKSNAIEYIETAMKLGALINKMRQSWSQKSTSAPEDDVIEFREIHPRLGHGLGRSDDAQRGQLFPQTRLSNGQRLDDSVGYRPFAAIDGDCEQALINSGIAVLNTRTEPGLIPVLEELGAKMVLVRPDKRILGTAKNLNDLKDFLELIASTATCAGDPAVQSSRGN